MTHSIVNYDRNDQRRPAFTLVELLVVMFIVLLLAAIALPSIKELLSDQLVARTARNITAYIDVARNRAISEGRQIGVLVLRNGADVRGRAHAIRIRQLVDVPAYTGDASDSVAILQSNGTNPITTATFDAANNQLLTLSATMTDNPATTNVSEADPQAPIKDGDYIELPGGRLVSFTLRYRDPSTAAVTDPVIIDFDLREPRIDYGQTSATFPSSLRPIAADRPVKYKVHRRPIISSIAPLDLPRGLAIDMNYSGVGINGNDFAPDADVTVVAPNIAIIFGPDGKVVSVTEVDYSPTLLATPGPPVARIVPPRGQIYFCLGDSDGVRPDNLFAQDPQATANILNQDNNWIVINPSTGRASAAPFASVAAIPAAVVTDPTDMLLDAPLVQARFFANLSDTVDQE